MAAENAGSGTLQTVVETPAYLSAAAGMGLPEDERRKIVDVLAARPMSGDLMEGTGGARKLRWAGRGNLTKAERKGLSELTKRLMASYRAGIRRNRPPSR